MHDQNFTYFLENKDRKRVSCMLCDKGREKNADFQEYKLNGWLMNMAETCSPNWGRWRRGQGKYGNVFIFILKPLSLLEEMNVYRKYLLKSALWDCSSVYCICDHMLLKYLQPTLMDLAHPDVKNRWPFQILLEIQASCMNNSTWFLDVDELKSSSVELIVILETLVFV